MGLACCTSGDNIVTPYDEDRSDCIFLGLEGAGKTLIVRRLQSGSSWSGLHDRERERSFHPNTWPTTGVEIAIVKTGEDGAFKMARTRELGGAMGPIWPNYYDDADALAYVVDLTTPDAWPSAAKQLKEILMHEHMQGKACVVLLNKVDKIQHDKQITAQLEKALDWESLLRLCKGGLDMHVVSAMTGENLDLLMSWLIRVKVQVNAKALKNKV